MEHAEYKRVIQGAESAVLMIHGILGTPRHFDVFVPLIPENVSVYNLLLDGHGRSVKDFSRSSMAKWELQVQQAVTELAGTHKRIYIAAHSLGTLLAIEQAVRNRAVAGLFLMAVPLDLLLMPAMSVNALKVYFNKAHPGDPQAWAAKNSYGIADEKNPLLYLGWTPRFLELFAKIRYTRKILPQLMTPCAAYQSCKDEMVSPKAATCLRKNPCITVTELKNSTHYYYHEADMALLQKAFKDFCTL